MKQVEIREFFIEGSEQQTSHVLLHITEPSAMLEREKGCFFALLELNFATIEHIEGVQQIINDIESIYYEPAKNVRSQFEIALEYINRKSAEILSPDVDIHGVVGVLRDYQLMISHRGGMIGFVTHSKDAQAKSIQIIPSSTAIEEDTVLFPHIIEGTVKPNDYIFFSTPFVEEYISPERVKKLLHSRSLSQSIEHMQKVLTGQNNERSFGGIVLHTQPLREPLPQFPHTKKEVDRSASQESLQQLLDAKQKTQETLSPPIFKSISAQISLLSSKKPKQPENRKRGVIETNVRARVENQIPEGTIADTTLIVIGRFLVKLFSVVGKLFKSASVAITKAVIATFILLTNKNNSRKDILDLGKKELEKKKQKIDDIPLATKATVGLILITLTIFSIHLTLQSIKNGIEEKRKAYATAILEVKDKTELAESKMIYEDNVDALDLLKQAQANLEALSPETDEEKRLYETYEKLIRRHILSLQKITLVTAKPILTLDEGVEPEGLAKVGSYLLAYSKTSPNITVYNTVTKETEVIQKDGISSYITATTPKEDDETIFITNTNGVAAFNKEKQILTAKDISYPVENSRISGATIYNTKLYVLDAENSQIYKHNQTQTGFDKGTPWITSSASFKNPTAITIDGKIYVLSKDGSITTFERGKELALDFQPIDPPLTNASDIWTYADVPYIYVFDGTANKIVVYNKQGTLVKQITSDELKNPSGFVVVHDEQMMYIVDGNVVYSLPLSN